MLGSTAHLRMATMVRALRLDGGARASQPLLLRRTGCMGCSTAAAAAPTNFYQPHRAAAVRLAAAAAAAGVGAAAMTAGASCAPNSAGWGFPDVSSMPKTVVPKQW